MFNLILIVVCLVAGVLLQNVKSLPQNAHVSINNIILYLCLPSMIVLSLPTLTWDASLISLVFVAWIVFFGAYMVFSFLGKKLNWERDVVGCLILTAGLGNTSFVGYPVLEALFGKEALKYAVLVDQPGTFLICSSFGLWIAHSYSQGSIKKRVLFKQVIVFPPFIAFCASLCMLLLGFQFQGMTQEILMRFGSMLAPLALISVGLQLKVREIKESLKFLTYGLAYKLIIGPTLIFFIYRACNVPHEIFRIALLESSMAPMITASILAASYGLQPRLAGLMVGVGVPLSFLTLTAWYFLL